MKKKKTRKYADYDRIDMLDVVTFGTTLYMREDLRAIKIVFPAGQSVTFAPMDEIEAEKSLSTP